MILTKVPYRKHIMMLVIFWITIFNVACNEVRKLNYASFSEAVEAGEITRGWIPYYLPESSHNIHIIYDITTSETWCNFEFSPNDVLAFKEALGAEVDFLPTRLHRIKKPDSLWPEFLSGNLDIQKINRSGFSSYILEEKCYQGLDNTALLFFVVNWEGGKGWFHNTICH